MAAIKTFDPYYQNFPEISRDTNFDNFWNKSIGEIKKISIEPEIKRNKKKDSSKFEAYDVSYNGFLKTRMYGVLYKPKKKEKTKAIIHIHDYNSNFDKGIVKTLTTDVSHFLIILRGHSSLYLTVENGDENSSVMSSPGYMVENIVDLETYYVKSIYLDILKSIDMLRLIKFLDCSKIGIIGKGLGAAAAFFTASYSERIGALACDSPQLCDLPMTQNISTGEITKEINDIVSIQKKRKDIIKKNLSYFDLINFSDKINCPAYFVTGLNDSIAPSECTMGLFNILKTEKTIEVYPEGDNHCGGGTQAVKTVKWVTDQLIRD